MYLPFPAVSRGMVVDHGILTAAPPTDALIVLVPSIVMPEPAISVAWFAARAVEVAVLIGLARSVVLLTFPRPTIEAVMPETVPVNVGLAVGALRAMAAAWAVLTGLFTSDVLSTLAKPTALLVTPVTVPVKVGLAVG